MTRYYHNGEIVGEKDPPVALVNWLRTEIDHASKIKLGEMSSVGNLQQRAGVHARLSALREVLIRIERGDPIAEKQ